MISVEIRVAIQALLAAVKYAKDDEDEPRFAACWSHDARLDIVSNGAAMAPVEGRGAIIAFYRRVWQTGGHGEKHSREVHVAEHPDIVALPEGRLRARHAAAFLVALDGQPRLRGFGTFDDVIVREDGEWRLAHRRATLLRNG